MRRVISTLLRRGLMAGAALALGALALGGGIAGAQEPINIGVALPLGGPNSEFVKRYMIAPSELAVKEANEAGGILGRQVKLTEEDTHYDGAGAVSALTKLADIDHVVAVFTGFTPLTLAQLPVAEEKHVIIMAPSTEHPDLTKSPWAVRMTPTADKAGIVIAQTARKLGMETTAIIGEDNESVRITTRAFTAEFAKLGGRVVGDESFKTQDNDMRGQLTKLRAARPDALYVMVSAGRPAALVLKEMGEIGFHPKHIFSNQLIEDREVKAMGGGIADGVIYTTLDIDPAFAAHFKAAMGYDPEVTSAKHYSATKLLFEAITRAGTGDDAAKIRDAIYNFGEFKSAMGDVHYTGTGEPVMLPVLKIVKSDGYVDYTP